MNADRIVSISAIIVSLGTLFMIMYQTNLIREEQKASVMPSLFIGYGIQIENNEYEELIRVSNRGMGPAFLREVRIIDGEDVFETDPVGYLIEKGLHNRRMATSINRLLPGAVIPANQQLEVYGKKLDSASTVTLRGKFSFPVILKDLFNMPDHQMDQSIDKVIIEIEYESIYGDRWVARSNRYAPEALDWIVKYQP